MIFLIDSISDQLGIKLKILILAPNISWSDPCESELAEMDIILQDLDPRETYLKWFSSNTSSRPNGRKLFEIPKINFKSGNYLSL